MRFFFMLALFTFSMSGFAQSKATQKLFKSIQKNDVVLAQNALLEGADVNGIDDFKRPTTTVLIEAVKHKRDKIVSLLLSSRADVNQRHPKDFQTGLMIATKNNDARMVKILLFHDADINLETLRGETALHIAALHNSTDAGKLLLSSREIDVNAGGENCPLVTAAKEGHTGMAILLKSVVSPVCLEKAIQSAEKNNKDMIVRILGR
ncbi:ankyrin repeat domain-containing protein [Peredibacter sp. HCB2-198]|uniref:ankyrin repeat domain-containing protein n=1 Tax=Peredibacter sp. HCB2-198 TaxID=3383025 RepID=UPI0038B65DBE